VTGPGARACSHPTPTARAREACVTGPDRTSELHNHPTPPQRQPAATFLAPGCKPAEYTVAANGLPLLHRWKGKSSPGSIRPKAASFPPPRRPLFPPPRRPQGCLLAHLCTAGIHRALFVSVSGKKERARVVEFLFAPDEPRDRE